ncbi:MAG TPA: DnaB-like helicase N-terminal domain-containing protein, partial [Nitriliruptorales bacterium]
MGPDPHQERGDLPPPAPTPSDGGRPASGGSAGRSGYDRVPPHSLDAEVSVLGAALLSKNAAAEVIELVAPDDFYRSSHRTVFEGVRELFGRGEPIDSVTVIDWLGRSGKLDEVGGAAAIHDLLSQVPTAANATHYARIVREKSILRRLIEVGTEIARIGYDGSDDPTVAVDRAEGLVYEVGQTGSAREYSHLKDLLNESFERIEQLAENRSEVTGLATGFNDLDRLTAGLQPQNLIIIAARPAMGKCAYGQLRITDSKTGAVHSIEELAGRRGCSPHPPGSPELNVFALDDRWTLQQTQPIDFIDNGVQPTYTLRTRSGRELRVTANHPFRTWNGWSALEDLAPGHVIAAPRITDVFGHDRLPDAEPGRLAREVGCDGGVARAPQAIFTAPRDQVAAFLCGLYACDGCARVDEGHGSFGITYTTVSERLARDVQHLLLRFGILAALRERQVGDEASHRRRFEIEVRDAENCRRFIEQIGIFSQEQACRRVLAAIGARGATLASTDLLPIEVWELILSEKGDRSWADVSEATDRPRTHDWQVGQRRPSRRLVAELAAALDSQPLRELSTSDVFWDEIVSIE